MNAAPGAMVILAALVASSAAAATGTPARPWFAAAAAAATVIEVFVARRVDAEVGDGAYRRWRRLELPAGLVGIRLLQAITGGAGGLATPMAFDRETVVAFVAFLLARSAANSTIDDLAAVDNGVFRADGTDPISRLRSRVIGYGIVCTVCAGYAVLGMGGLFDLGRPAAPVMRIEPLLYLAVALPALSRVALRAQAARWRRDGAVVDQSTGASWVRTGMAVSAAVTVLTAAVWAMSFGASSVVAYGITRAGPVGEWVADRLAALGDLEQTTTERRPGETIDPSEAFESAPDRMPPWLGEVAFWAIAIGFIAWAARKGGQVRRRDRPAQPLVRPVTVRDVFRVLAGMIRAIWDSLVRLFRRTRLRFGASGSSAGPLGPSRLSPWNPDDPLRRRVAVAYRRSSAHVAGLAGRRRRGETLREYAERTGAEHLGSSGDFGLVTGAYEEARFSEHSLTDDHAGAVESAADRVQADGGSVPRSG